MENFTVRSRSGTYHVQFAQDVFCALAELESDGYQFLVDRKVATLYARQFDRLLADHGVLLIDAEEGSKTLGRLERYASALMDQEMRRDHALVAVGGGIIQDIACFLASTLFRGLDWEFVPTTLLAQADSCIGSKSSINVGEVKNLMGTFHPPRRITIASSFLETLDEADVRSGVGEILKVHIIDGVESFTEIERDYDAVLSDRSAMEKYIWRSLMIKKPFIEEDELDRGPRNVLNYGHSFGHAIEAATDFAVPHGISVTIGMDMANFVALSMHRIDKAQHERLNRLLMRNCEGFDRAEIAPDRFFNAIAKDKKRTDGALAVILLDRNLRPEKVRIPNDESFRAVCRAYLSDRSRR